MKLAAIIAAILVLANELRGLFMAAPILADLRDGQFAPESLGLLFLIAVSVIVPVIWWRKR